MKFYSLMLAAGLLLFSGCGFGGDDTDDPALGGDDLSETEQNQQSQNVKESKDKAEAKYNSAFQLKVKAGEGPEAQELLVIYQGSKDGVQNVVLAVDDKQEMKATSSDTSADFSQKRINLRLANKLKVEKNICTGKVSKDLLNIYGSLAVVTGTAVNVLTGEDVASGYTVAGGLENQSSEGAAVIKLSKAGSAAVAFTEVAGSRAASSLSLGEYADWFMRITAPGFCAQFATENPQPADESDAQQPAADGAQQPAGESDAQQPAADGGAQPADESDAQQPAADGGAQPAGGGEGVAA